MTVLVTGGAGYIGSHVALALLDRGEDVVVYDDLSTGFNWAVPEQVPLVVGDIADSNLVRKTLVEYGIECIMHFAAKTVVPASVAEPLAYYFSNTVKTRSLLESAAAEAIKYFVFSSTAAVYGEPKLVPISEDSELKPINPYGRSKLMSEWILQDAATAHQFKYVTLRYFNVAGADPALRSGQSTANATHLIKRAVQTALGQHPCMEVFGADYPTSDGTCIRDYIHVADLAAAHINALMYLQDGGSSGTFNCGYGKGVSVFEIVEAVREVAATTFEVKLSPRRRGDPSAVVARCDAARRALNWHPRHESLREIVLHAYEWEKKLLSRDVFARAASVELAHEQRVLSYSLP